MPRVVSDIIDVYVFRRLNARVQFLLLQRRDEVALPHTWQAFHSQVYAGDTTLETVQRAVKSQAGLNVDQIYSADYVNQFYDESRDALVLAPVFAVTVRPQAPVDLAREYKDAAWFDRNEATTRLAFSGQRWAVRHIDEILSLGDAEMALYRIDPSTPQPEMEDESGPNWDDDDDDLIIDETQPEPMTGDDALSTHIIEPTPDTPDNDPANK